MSDPQHREALGDELQRSIEDLPEDTVSLAFLLEQFGDNGLLLLTALLTLVFLIPVSIPGVSTVFGAAILLIGLSRLFGRPLWLPAKVLNRQLSSEKLRPTLQRGLLWVRRMERASRPGRLGALVDSRAAAVCNNLALVLGALLLMMPFGFIPFSNTLPAVAVLFLAIGLIQRDGVAVALGHLANLATLVYFAVLIGGGGLVAQQLWQRFFPAG